MINKTNLKYYFIPASILFVVFLIILIVPMGNKKTNNQRPIISPSPVPIQTPTPFLLLSPTTGPTPTLIPLRSTGGDITQELPQDVKLFSEQKTELRRATPLLGLSFGGITFDYENDLFILTLKEPKDQSQIVFNLWLEQTYPAIPKEQFAIQ